MIKPLKNNSGMTIISVVVAFGILVTACILFTKGMQLATNMIIMTGDEKDGIKDSIIKYYTERATEPTSEVALDFNKPSDDPSVPPQFVFKLHLPIAKTEPEKDHSGNLEEYSYGFEFFSSNKARGIEPPTVPPPEGP